jgi:endonuclease YncB( thermonuclease family)
MRKYRLFGAVAVAALLVYLLWRHEAPRPPESGAPASVASSETIAPQETAKGQTVPLPTTPAPASDLAPAASPDTATANIAASPAATAAVAAPSAKALPKLAEIAVPPHIVHIVPEDGPAPPPRPIDIRRAPGAADAQGAAPEPPTRGAATQSAALPPGPTATSARLPQIAGLAEPMGATALRIAGRPYRFFGVRAPENGDRCAASALGAKPLPCGEQANRVLAARLAKNPGVSCRLPSPKSADAAICLDGDGVDLGGFLVGEGLALADPNQSHDYVGAESIARNNHRGLWLYR